MTLADRTAQTRSFPEDSFPSRSWRSRLLRYLPEEPPSPRKASRALPKPPDEIADFLFMSMLDEKTPPEASGSADLLDSLVQDHLAHSPADASPTDPPLDPAAPAVAPDLSDDERTALLQREIATLLRDTQTTIAPNPEKIEKPQSPAAPAADADITPEELDTLLADQAQSITTESLTNPAAASASAHTEQQLSDAEGLLAEELNQLMGETAPQASRAEAVPATVTPAAIAEKPAAAPAPSAVAAPSVAPPSPAPTAVPAGPLPLTPEEAHAADAAQAADAAPTPKPHRRLLLHDIALLVAQVIDLPFGWINELDKNVIGIAAFLLLLGGIVLYTLSRVMH